MKNNPYKAFIAYKHSVDFDRLKVMNNVFTDPLDPTDESDFAHLAHRDPIGGQWRNSGLAIVARGQYVLEIAVDTYLMHIQFNERILPGKVRDEKVRARVLKVVEQQGRKVSKKQFREIRDDVEAELLPQAFIRRSIVPVIFMSQYMLLFTSSGTRSDDCCAILLNVFNVVVEDFLLAAVKPKANVRESLTNLIDDSPDNLHVSDFVVLKSDDPEEKKTVRIKDLDLGSSEVTALMKKDYKAVELGINYYQTDQTEETLSFKLTDKFVFKGCVMPKIDIDRTADDKDAELVSFSWMIARVYLDAMKAVMSYMGEDQSFDAGDPDDDTPFDEEEEEL